MQESKLKFQKSLYLKMSFFSIENLMKEIKPKIMEKNDFQIRDGWSKKRFYSFAKTRIEVFRIKWIVTGWKFLIGTSTKKPSLCLRPENGFWLQRLINIISILQFLENHGSDSMIETKGVSTKVSFTSPHFSIAVFIEFFIQIFMKTELNNLLPIFSLTEKIYFEYSVVKKTF